MDAWAYRLRDAYDAGYYKTEPAEGQQISFPWQNKTCRDCPFWANSICQVHAEYRSSTAHTCGYFDRCNRGDAQNMMQDRQWRGFRHWWEWFNDRDVTH